MVTQASVRPLLGTATLDECIAIRRPHILQVGKFWAPHHGGIETHLRELCMGLGTAVDVDVLVSNTSRGFAEERHGALHLKRMPLMAQVASAPLSPSLFRCLRESEADLVHIHLPNPPAVIAYLLSGHRGKLVVTFHSDIVRRRWMAKLLNPTVNALLNRADAIVCFSPNHLEHLEALENFRQKCHVIPHGLPFEYYDEVDTAKVSRIRGKYRVPIILGVGRLVYYKGFEYLIRAMRQIDAHLLLIGEGPLHRLLREHVVNAGVEDKVTFLGKVEELRPYYHACDVFVLPSIARSEAFGIVQLEAMACGKPVVNTALDTGVPWVSQNGVTGLTVPCRDSNALASAISSLLSSPTLAQQYGRAARRRVEQEFSSERMLSRTLSLYSDVLGIS